MPDDVYVRKAVAGDNITLTPRQSSCRCLAKNRGHQQMKWLVLFFSVVCFMGCQPRQDPPPQRPFRADIVAHMDAVIADFLLTPLHDVFSLEQLAWLQVHRHQLSDAVNVEIRGGSTLAIQMAVYLRLETAIPVLRERLLKLQSTYMWEGPDYSTEEPFMRENQYPYHRIYIWTIQGIAQAPVAAVVKLTPIERQYLNRRASKAAPDVGDAYNTVDGQAWCAKWLLTQLEPDRKGAE